MGLLTKPTAADTYHQMVATLSRSEADHLAALEALNKAIQERQPSAITRTRNAARETETRLAAHYAGAITAHRSYWKARESDMQRKALEALAFLKAYDLVAKAAGNASSTPSATLACGVYIPTTDEICTDGVPIEPPDCATLDDYKGSWRTV